MLFLLNINIESSVNDTIPTVKSLVPALNLNEAYILSYVLLSKISETISSSNIFLDDKEY